LNGLMRGIFSNGLNSTSFISVFPIKNPSLNLGDTAGRGTRF
jgi:hypothetical protein